ncbi:Na-translocating system protein MpsC family protein, partial [Bacillus paralicheniformis]
MKKQKVTKGSLEAEISKTLTQWEKDYLGRGSVSVKTDILRNMVIISLNGILTPAEYELCST